jgi:hypothetical protein
MFSYSLLKTKGNISILSAISYGRLRHMLPVCGFGLLLMFPSVQARELSSGGPPEQPFERAVEESVEESVEEAVEEAAAEAAAEAAEEAVEEAIVERVLSAGGPPIEQQIEDQVEEAVEEELLEGIEEAVEDSVAESVAEDVEDSVEESIEEVVEEVVENTIEGTLQDDLEDVIEQEVEEEVAQALEQDLEGSLEQVVETQVADAIEEELESEIDEILEGIENRFEIDESRIHRDQWLVMAEPEVFDKLAEEGYLFATITDLPGMGMRLAEVAAPASFDITDVRQGVIDVVGKERAEVDLNHIYTAGTMIESPSEQGIGPREALAFPADIDQMSLRIGMIDSAVDTSHSSLDKSAIQTRAFVSDDAEKPNFHGTAIASIIAGNSPEYMGLAPNTQLYAATVFEHDRERGEIASTVSLVRALDWLISSGVDVVNISLAGPPNRLLEAALDRASEKGVMILAAAGNGGPVAQPMYPAAYGSVVAVTAVDADGQVFRLANRGEYLDISAPGVGLLHANSEGGYSASSGTSFAVPFAAAAVARLRQLQPDENALQLLYESAQDLGPPGRDNIYGYGLLRPKKS